MKYDYSCNIITIATLFAWFLPSFLLYLAWLLFMDNVFFPNYYSVVSFNSPILLLTYKIPVLKCLPLLPLKSPSVHINQSSFAWLDLPLPLSTYPLLLIFHSPSFTNILAYLQLHTALQSWSLQCWTVLSLGTDTYCPLPTEIFPAHSSGLSIACKSFMVPHTCNN